MKKKHFDKKDDALALAMGRYRRDEFQKLIDSTVPCVYASVALALYEKGWRFERINKLFVETQRIWDEHCMDPGNMCDYCYAVTGIDVQYKE